MDPKLNILLEELLVTLDNSDIIKEINTLKQEIYSDNELKNKIDEFKNVSQYGYSNELIKLKKDIIDNDKVKKFKKMQQELNSIIIEINKSLSKLTDEKSCQL